MGLTRPKKVREAFAEECDRNRAEFFKLLNDYNLEFSSKKDHNTITVKEIREMRRKRYTALDKAPLCTDEDMLNLKELIKTRGFTTLD